MWSVSKIRNASRKLKRARKNIKSWEVEVQRQIYTYMHAGTRRRADVSSGGWLQKREGKKQPKKLNKIKKNLYVKDER